MPNHSLAFAALIGSLAIGIPQSHAEAVRLVTGNDFEPYTDETLLGGGLATVLVRRTFERAGDQVTIDFTGWTRGYRFAKEGQYDGTFPYLLTEEREADMLASESLYSTRVLLVSSADRPLEFESLDALSGMTLCLPVGFAIAAEVEALVESDVVLRQEPQSYGDCFRLLLGERADFMVVDEDTLHTTIVEERLERADFHVAGKPVRILTNHLLISRAIPDGPAILDRFNAALADLYEEGIVGDLFLDYAGFTPQR